MAREIGIGDEVAITATVRKRIDDRAVLHIPTANFPYSIIDPKAKPGDEIRLDGDVVFVDAGRVTVKVLGTVTVDIDTVEMVRKYRPPQRRTPLRDKPD